MAHHNTVFRQLLDLLPRHEFDAEARQHQKGQRLRVMSRWAQFVALGLGQLGGLQSLRDIVGNLCAQPHKLYHLGVQALVSRSSLARVNAEQPYTLYEALFSRLLARCQQRAPRHGFRFKNKLYAIDATTIDVCLAAFPWASFRRTKGAIKLHVGLEQAGHLPSFLSVTDGKAADVTVARTWTCPAGSVVVADRAYLDFGWLPDRHRHRRQPEQARTKSLRVAIAATPNEAHNGHAATRNGGTDTKLEPTETAEREHAGKKAGANASTRHDGVEPATNEETREASEGRGGRPEVRNAKRGSKSLRVAISRRVRTDENRTNETATSREATRRRPGPTGTAG